MDKGTEAQRQRSNVTQEAPSAIHRVFKGPLPTGTQDTGPWASLPLFHRLLPPLRSWPSAGGWPHSEGLCCESGCCPCQRSSQHTWGERGQ